MPLRSMKVRFFGLGMRWPCETPAEQNASVRASEYFASRRRLSSKETLPRSVNCVNFKQAPCQRAIKALTARNAGLVRTDHWSSVGDAARQLRTVFATTADRSREAASLFSIV